MLSNVVNKSSLVYLCIRMLALIGLMTLILIFDTALYVSIEFKGIVHVIRQSSMESTSTPTTPPTLEPTNEPTMEPTLSWTVSTQQMLSELSLQIASHDYSTFNDDIYVDGHSFAKLTPSLVLDALRNKTIIMFGDSTVLRFFAFLSYCVAHYAHNAHSNACDFEHGLLNLHSDEWNERGKVNAKHIKFPENKQHMANVSKLACDGLDGCFKTEISEIDFVLLEFENRNDRNLSQLFALYQSFVDYKPDIIYFHPSGLHLLHLEPQRKMESHAFEIINSFEQNLLRVYNAAEEAQRLHRKNVCLIYRNTSPMCTKKDSGEYKKVRDYYRNEFVNQSNDTQWARMHQLHELAISDCIEKYANLSIENVEEICQEWTEVNLGGIQHVNQLMRQFVHSVQHKAYGDSNGVFYYDRYSLFHIEQCATEAKDTCHWVPSYGADLLFFVHFLRSACSNGASII
eukprot:CAMPEP_0197031394 /NCGR_PEP_ID=MMETSP1384-20130603/10409_1 /TAXON_ID=29189 /ORGANISM="Ammonia sp." /LENGTH=456 /DNA_ID=CAMNT_0042460913 /DNA_START=32 /DNA_END=1402 /DNA_ORIENTATION=+